MDEENSVHLTRCHDQGPETLDDFYRTMSEGEQAVWREVGEAMLSLLGRLRALPDSRLVWGLTSHHRLCLLAQDSFTTPWFVIVSALSAKSYVVEYRMPEQIAPWPNAYVRGEAQSEADAVQLILKAMDRTGGWGGSAG